MALRSAVAALALLGPALAQYSGWEDEVVNSTMCTWRLPRTAILRDTLYIDGGSLVWFQGLETGEYRPMTDWNPRGYLLSLNLTTPFPLSANITTHLSTHPRTGASSAISPNYVSGALLANDAQFFPYGGMTLRSNSYPDPDADFVWEYQAHPYDASDRAFSPGFISEELPDGMTRYLAYGAGVSVPSENKAFYFSGLHAPGKGVIYESYAVEERVPSNVSDTLISVTFDDEEQNVETWRNETLPGDVQKRAGASGVFVPVGKEGILVFVGGATFPEFAYKRHKSANPAALRSESKSFMTTIDIYDIASGDWYQQQTSATAPPILAQGCAVVRPAPDRSSFNIYHYGGYSAEDQTSAFNDDVWVLSLPSFKWIKAKSGTSDHARAGHSCEMPYPDQMMVVGGFTPLVGTSIDCLLGGVIQILNLTSLEWLEGYDPAEWSEYAVPDVVSAEIGGSSSGGATESSPEDGWDDDDLEGIFNEEYPTERITTWYPYDRAESTERPEVDGEESDGGGGGGGLPGWVPPTLGVVLGLIFVITVGVAFIFWRRRKILKRASMAQSSVASGK